MFLPFEAMIFKNIKADRIIIISDNECNYNCNTPVQRAVEKFRDKIGENVWVHAIDTMGYGTQQFCGSRFNLITGWSDKMLEFIKLAEEGADSLIKHIENCSFNII